MPDGSKREGRFVIAIPIIPYWAKWALVAVLALACVAFGWVKGVDHAEDRHATFVAQVATLGAEQAARTGAIIRNQARLTEDTRNGYAQSLDALHKYYAGRMRDQSRPGGGALPAVPNPSGGTDARPTDPGAGPPGDPEEDQVARRCAETTLMLLTLQAWVAKQKGAEAP